MMIPTVKTMITFQGKDSTERKIVDFIDLANLNYNDIEDAVCDALPSYLNAMMDWQKYYPTYFREEGYVKFGNMDVLLFTARITPVLEFDDNYFELNPIKI
ncbi:hypothetical protein [Bacillus phage vB_BanS-Thrax5]|nr:hypothetical protein [Bacillus phage vB_BanS-Thrax5]